MLRIALIAFLLILGTTSSSSFAQETIRILEEPVRGDRAFLSQDFYVYIKNPDSTLEGAKFNTLCLALSGSELRYMGGLPVYRTNSSTEIFYLHLVRYEKAMNRRNDSSQPRCLEGALFFVTPELWNKSRNTVLEDERLGREKAKIRALLNAVDADKK